MNGIVLSPTPIVGISFGSIICTSIEGNVVNVAATDQPAVPPPTITIFMVYYCISSLASARISVIFSGIG